MSLLALIFFMAVTQDHLSVLDAERASLTSLSFVAEIETPKPNGRKGRSSMTFDYRTPCYRSEIKMGVEGSLVTVADGTTIWSHETRTGRIYRQKQSSAAARLKSMGPVDPITAIATPTVPLKTLYHLRSATLSGANPVLELVPRKSVANYDRIILTTTPDGKTPIAAEAFKRSKSVATIRFLSFRKNASIPPSQFIFRPPPNARITDM